MDLYDKTGHVRADAIEKLVGFDAETVQRALRALYTVPYFQQSDATSYPQNRFPQVRAVSYRTSSQPSTWR